MTNVGWIGLGAMGSPMASFVAKAGHAVTAFDIDPQRAAALAGDGVKAAATIGDAAAGADVLVLMVATASRPNRCSTGTATPPRRSNRAALCC